MTVKTNKFNNVYTFMFHYSNVVFDKDSNYPIYDSIGEIYNLRKLNNDDIFDYNKKHFGSLQADLITYGYSSHSRSLNDDDDMIIEYVDMDFESCFMFKSMQDGYYRGRYLLMKKLVVIMLRDMKIGSLLN